MELMFDTDSGFDSLTVMFLILTYVRRNNNQLHPISGCMRWVIEGIQHR